MRDSRIEQSLQQAKKALQALGVMVRKPMDEDRGNIDASIQRFEFTIELFWKLLKRILEAKGVEVRYPKDVLQEAYAGGLIDDDKMWLKMLRDRNLTSHTYDENLADEIYAHIKLYYPILEQALQKVENTLSI
ncbi:nucleotidyltransferase substrate binding protein [Candidatus Dependentiae bacterium]|jgi:nucleotidyltransferase substrate binding protein (TIGR01987 family)|nr:nucleotidyltransferase substrate binding protein [Candidatus Dependentiae bacterium]